MYGYSCDAGSRCELQHEIIESQAMWAGDYPRALDRFYEEHPTIILICESVFECAGTDALTCYTGGPVQNTIVKMRVPSMENVAHVCARYRYQCYPGSHCSQEEVAKGAYAWQYMYTSEDVCASLGRGGLAKDVTCCRTDLCNGILASRDRKTKVMNPRQIFPLV
jgi:hypothetical protein